MNHTSSQRFFHLLVGDMYPSYKLIKDSLRKFQRHLETAYTYENLKNFIAYRSTSYLSEPPQFSRIYPSLPHVSQGFPFFFSFSLLYFPESLCPFFVREGDMIAIVINVKKN